MALLRAKFPTAPQWGKSCVWWDSVVAVESDRKNKHQLLGFLDAFSDFCDHYLPSIFFVEGNGGAKVFKTVLLRLGSSSG